MELNPNRSPENWPVAVVTSVLFHGLLLGVLVTLGWNSHPELSPAIMVDMLAPAPSIAATAKKDDSRWQVNQPSKHEFRREVLLRRPAEPLNDYRQETIPLNTRRLKYIEYSGQIKQRIYAHWHYPEPARQERIQGQLMLEFGILDTGELAGIEVIKSSGHPSLDHGTVDAILAASPFSPLPNHFRLDRLNIQARFHYRLVAKASH